MQLSFYFDQTRCIGCHACTVACKGWHDVPAGPASRRRVSAVEKGTYPKLFAAFISAGCFHCATPSCTDACPTDAVSKRSSDGIVVVDRDECLGADSCDRFCLEACPYNAPQFGSEENAKMQKCDFCIDRLDQGKRPICVDACPTRAMDAGPLSEIQEKYGKTGECTGFTYSNDVMPSVVMKPKPEMYPVVTILKAGGKL